MYLINVYVTVKLLYNSCQEKCNVKSFVKQALHILLYFVLSCKCFNDGPWLCNKGKLEGVAVHLLEKCVVFSDLCCYSWQNFFSLFFYHLVVYWSWWRWQKLKRLFLKDKGFGLDHIFIGTMKIWALLNYLVWNCFDPNSDAYSYI